MAIAEGIAILAEAGQKGREAQASLHASRNSLVRMGQLVVAAYGNSEALTARYLIGMLADLVDHVDETVIGIEDAFQILSHKIEELTSGALDLPEAIENRMRPPGAGFQVGGRDGHSRDPNDPGWQLGGR